MRMLKVRFLSPAPIIMSRLKSIKVDQIRHLYLDKHHTVNETARKLGVSVWRLYAVMDSVGIKRRSYSDAGYLSYGDKPRFSIKKKLTVSDEKLKVAGTMLYWAEGTLKGGTVDFANSDPRMVKIFLKFLRKICGVKEDRLRIYLYTYSYLDLDGVKKFWRDVTNISIKQFTKPYIREGHPNLSKRKLAHGLVHVRYNDKRLLGTIDSWIKEYSCSL